MAIMRVPGADAEHFYRAGALGLRALQDRRLGPERFTIDANARWRAFCGELTESHRLDLLLRDGAAMYPLAFAARSVFGLPGLSHDEPFGPTWASLTPVRAGTVLREAENLASTGALSDLLRSLADLWGLAVAGPDPSLVATIKASTRLVLAGAGAVIAVSVHMAERGDCDFGDQVLLVAAHPGVRQLAGVAAAMTGSRKTPRTLPPIAIPNQAAALGFERATLAISSPDASSAEAEAVATLAAGLGA